MGIITLGIGGPQTRVTYLITSGLAAAGTDAGVTGIVYGAQAVATVEGRAASGTSE